MPKVLKFAICFAAGALLVHQQAELVSGLFFFALAGLVLPFAGSKTPQYLIAGLIGLGWSNTFAGFILDSTPGPHLFGQAIVVTGKVAGLPKEDSAYTRFDLHLEAAESETAVEFLNSVIRLRWYGKRPELIPGQRWRLAVKLKKPRGYRNMGLFDYELYLFRNRIRATGYVLPNERGSLLASGVGYSINRVRYVLAEKLKRGIGDHPVAGIIGALAVGQRSGITQDQWTFFRRAGLSHLMAISGLHIGLAGLFGYTLAGALWRLSGSLSRILPVRQIAIVVALLSALGYSALAGFPLPTTRALTMLLVYTLGVVSLRRYSPETCLGISIFVVVCLNPMDTSSAGFWLSFVAVWIIFRSHKIVSRLGSAQTDLSAVKPSRRGRILSGVLSLGLIQCSLFLGLFPVMAFFFSEVSLVAPLVNFLVVPVFGFTVVPVVLAGVVATLLSVDELGGFLLLSASWIIENLLAVVRPLGYLELATLPLSKNAVFTLLSTVLVGFLVFWRRSWFLSLPAIVLLGLIVAWPRSDLQPGGFRLHLLDVGQGLSVLIQTAERMVLYDAGPQYGQFSLGEAVIVPTVRRHGQNNIDVAVISHFAADHVGGLAGIQKSMPIGMILSGESLAIPGSEACAQGRVWEWDGVVFEILWPPRESHHSGNDQSCVIQIRSETGTALLTGDIEGFAEKALIKSAGKTLDSDILLVPHHGSGTSSSERFIEFVAPEVAIVSRGSSNRYGHPHPEIRQRYHNLGIRWLDTAMVGQITLTSHQKGFRIVSWKDHRRRFWHS